MIVRGSSSAERPSSPALGASWVASRAFGTIWRLWDRHLQETKALQEPAMEIAFRTETCQFQWACQGSDLPSCRPTAVARHEDPLDEGVPLNMNDEI